MVKKGTLAGDRIVVLLLEMEHGARLWEAGDVEYRSVSGVEQRCGPLARVFLERIPRFSLVSRPLNQPLPIHQRPWRAPIVAEGSVVIYKMKTK